MGRRRATDLRYVVAKQLRFYRHARGLTQLDLIDRCNDELSQTALSQYETAKAMPSLGMLELLAGALQVEPAALLLDPDRSDREKLASHVLTCGAAELRRLKRTTRP